LHKSDHANAKAGSTPHRWRATQRPAISLLHVGGMPLHSGTVEGSAG
jgi:hypothetical protein